MRVLDGGGDIVHDVSYGMHNLYNSQNAFPSFVFIDHNMTVYSKSTSSGTWTTKNLITEIKPLDLENLIKWKIVKGGMIPKIENCVCFTNKIFQNFGNFVTVPRTKFSTIPGILFVSHEQNFLIFF